MGVITGRGRLAVWMTCPPTELPAATTLLISAAMAA